MAIQANQPGKRPERIVSLAPSVTSILLRLGAGRELVAVSKWCEHVAKVGGRPRVGDCWKLDIEEVMRLRPTLLIGSVPFAPETVNRILAQPVAFLALNPRSLADIESDIRILGRIAQRASAAEQLVVGMQDAFAAIGHKAATRKSRTKPRVYSEAWSNPRISSPPWVGELIRLAGGIPVVPAGERVTDAQIARAKPDVIILAWAATGDRAKPGAALQNPLWKDVPAVRQKRVFVIRDEFLNTPGPPLVQGVAELFRAIHRD